MIGIRNPFDRDIIGFRTAINARVIASPAWTFQKWNYLKWVTSLPPPKPGYKQDFDDVRSNPKSLRYRQQTIGIQNYPGSGEDWRIELARYYVEQSRVGIVKSYEQFLRTESLQTETVWSGSSHWGDPRTPLGTWFFRLSSWQGQNIAWINQLNPVPTRPDYPFEDMPDETGIWYPLHSSTSNNIHLIVPGGYVLRVFFECDGDDANTYLPSVGARLRGSIQSSFSPESRYQIRTHW